MTQDIRPNLLKATNEDTSGPYFPIYFQDESLEDLTVLGPGIVGGPRGQHISLSGRVLDRHGDLANGVLMEFWQANSKGIYNSPTHAGHSDLDPRFNGYGRLRSASGEYKFRTIMPGASGKRAPNITITLFSDGISRIVTQVFFEGQKANETDPVLQPLDSEDQVRLIARHDGRTDDGAEVYLLDIIMAGPNETPFFDDFES